MSTPSLRAPSPAAPACAPGLLSHAAPPTLSPVPTMRPVAPDHFARYRRHHSLSALTKGASAMLESGVFLSILYREDGSGLTTNAEVQQRHGEQGIGRNWMRPATSEDPESRAFPRWRDQWRPASEDPRWYAACLFVLCEDEGYTDWKTSPPEAAARLLSIWKRRGAALLQAIEAHQTAPAAAPPARTAAAPAAPSSGPDTRYLHRALRAYLKDHASDTEGSTNMLAISAFQWAVQALASDPHATSYGSEEVWQDDSSPSLAALERASPPAADTTFGQVHALLTAFIQEKVIDFEYDPAPGQEAPLPRGTAIALAVLVDDQLRIAHSFSASLSEVRRLNQAQALLGQTG